MNRHFERLFAILILFICIQSSHAVWRPTNGPYGGAVTSLVSKEGLLIAGTERGGVFISTDGGRRWERSNSGMEGEALNSGLGYDNDLHVNTIAADQKNIWMGTNTGIVYRSTDGGGSWFYITQFFPWDERVNGIPIRSLAAKDNFVFAGTDAGLYQSTDFGKTWTTHTIESPSQPVQNVVIKDSTVLYGYRNQVRYSTDFGSTWQFSTHNCTQINAFGIHDNAVYIGVYSYPDPGGMILDEKGIKRSTDNGATWSDVKLNDWNITAFASDGICLYASVGFRNGTVFRSNDHGATWKQIETGLPAVQSMIFSDGRLLAGTTEGVFASADSGKHWAASNDGLSAMTLSAMAVRGGKIYAGTMAGNGVYVTSDRGDTWKEANAGFDEGMSGYQIADLMSRGDTLYSLCSGCIYRSVGNDPRWGRISPDQEYSTNLWVENGEIFAAGYHQFFSSSDQGVTWTKKRMNLPAYDIKDLFTSGNRIFVSTTVGNFVSADGGENWELIPIFLT
jgi:photosystem II stability/assembly factor-like uncharacterized protein